MKRTLTMPMILLSSQWQHILRRMPKILYQSSLYFIIITMFHARLFMFALFFCCLLGSSVRAQESARSTASLTTVSETITDEVSRLPWTVGMDLLPLISKNYLPGNSFFTKRNVYPENRLPGAIRLRTGLGFDSFENNIPTQTPSTYGSRGVDILFRPGYEWQRPMGKHQIIYGFDAHLEYSFYHYGSPQNTDMTSRHAFGVGTVGVIGYQFFITPHVSFSTEASYEIIFNRERIETDHTPSDLPELRSITVVYNNNLEGNFRPLYVVNFHFHF